VSNPILLRYEHNIVLAGVAQSVSVGIGLIRVRHSRAVVDISTQTVCVFIVVRIIRAVINIPADAIAVRIVGRIVRTTVAGVAQSIAIDIRLIDVRHCRAVIGLIKDTVSI
jgi:hypothetical protein